MAHSSRAHRVLRPRFKKYVGRVRVSGGPFALTLHALFVAAFLGCGSRPEPKVVAPVVPVASSSTPSPMKVVQELGSVDEDAVSAAFERLSGALQDCHRRGLARVRYLGGEVQLFLRLGVDGKARVVHLKESSLGDRETERCLVDVLAQAPWPKPDGGEAEVEKHLGFEPPNGSRRPVDWAPERVSAVLVPLGVAARACKGESHGVFTVTAYVVAKGKKGRVLAAGVAPPSADADAKADCLLRLVESIRLPSPGHTPAKVSFTL